MTTTTAPTTTAAAIADELGVNPVTVRRWAHRWHGPTGPGNYRHLTDIDAMVARAWHAINGGPGHGGHSRVHQDVLNFANTAIRLDPRPWLAVSAKGAATFDTAPEAAVWWAATGTGACTLIHLAAPEETG